MLLTSSVSGTAVAQDFSRTLKNRFRDFKQKNKLERVVIVSDRDIYAPGDLVWLTGISYDFFEPVIVDESKEVSVEIHRGNMVPVVNKTFQLEEGQFAGFVKLPDDAEEGVYLVQGFTRFTDNGNNFSKQIIVKEKTIPPFIIESGFADKHYRPGEELLMNIRFSDYYNEPKRKVSYVINFYDGETRIDGMQGKTKNDGVATIRTSIPEEVKSGLLSYHIEAEYKKVRSENAGQIPLASEHIYVDFYPQSGRLVAGVESEVAFYVYDALGKAVAAEVELREGETVLQSLRSDASGIGEFSFQPEVDKTYYLKIKSPVFVEKEYILPPAGTNGLIISLNDQVGDRISIGLEASGNRRKHVYLIGMTYDKICWESEHIFAGDTAVSVDLSGNAKGNVQLAAIDSDGNVLAVRNVYMGGEKAKSFELEVNMVDPGLRGKVAAQIKEINQNGRLVFKVVNAPWSSDALNNPDLENLMLFPGDFLTEPIAHSGLLAKGDLRDGELSAYYKVFTRGEFTIAQVLGSKPEQRQNTLNENVMKNIMLMNQIFSMGTCVKESSMIIWTNTLADQYFYTSNPKYSRALYTEKAKKSEPTYKKLLESGTPILDVLQSIKPFNMQGDYIVFLGGSNSINFQGGALIVIDGVNRGTSASILNSLSPYDVESIKASTDPTDIQRYTGLNSVGIIEIELKKGKTTEVIKHEGPPDDYEFEAPNYDRNRNSSVDDYRTTLYWFSKIVMSDQTLNFFNSDLFSNVFGEVLFFPDEGAPSQTKFGYEVK